MHKKQLWQIECIYMTCLVLQEETAEEQETMNGDHAQSAENRDRAEPAANGDHAKTDEEVDKIETETKDEPESRLEDPEVEDIKTITAGDTMYSSAKKFEDLPISEPLLQVLRATQLGL